MHATFGIHTSIAHLLKRIRKPADREMDQNCYRSTPRFAHITSIPQPSPLPPFGIGSTSDPAAVLAMKNRRHAAR
jgi:hypothetical protein